MTVVVCEFCNKTLCNKYVLEKHQATAKFCLLIQKKPVKKENVCEYCDKSFTRKDALDSHMSICSAYHISEDLDTHKVKLAQANATITKLKLRTKELKARILELEKESSERLGKLKVYKKLKSKVININADNIAIASDGDLESALSSLSNLVEQNSPDTSTCSRLRTPLRKICK